LTADSSFITAWSNDIGYGDVFARQVEAYGQAGDILVCFSTSGNSENVLNAITAAHKKEMICIAITGKDGGTIQSSADYNVTIPSHNTQRIQELHLHCIHTICTLIETNLFKDNNSAEMALVDYQINGTGNGHDKEFVSNRKSRWNEKGNIY
jgi:D-inositol-3-phosphate glycosyltransferase